MVFKNYQSPKISLLVKYFATVLLVISCSKTCFSQWIPIDEIEIKEQKIAFDSLAKKYHVVSRSIEDNSFLSLVIDSVLSYRGKKLKIFARITDNRAGLDKISFYCIKSVNAKTFIPGKKIKTKYNSVYQLVLKKIKCRNPLSFIVLRA